MFGTWHKGILSIEVEPYKYAVPIANEIKVVAPKGIVENPGTVYSLPAIVVYGSGKGTISINGNDYIVNPVTDGMVIDSDTMQVYKGNSNLNNVVNSEDFPWIKTGENIITLNGGIAQIVITPRWRYL